MEVPPAFASVESECRYWKERAMLYHKEWTDIKQEFDEYVEQSRQMEAEMDATLDQKQAAIKDLRQKLSALEKDNESLKLKVESHGIEFGCLEQQLEAVRKDRDSMKDYLRQLEQKNDDLERAHRILNESIVDFEKMLDKAYEKNALLEMEVDEKEVLQEKLQRLMDETRDLKQELNVKARFVPNGGGALGAMTGNGHDSGFDTAAITARNNKNSTNTSSTTTTTNLKRKSYADPTENILNGNAMTPSSRTTALNIVADMLRKLNAMETKLKTYREHGPTAVPPRQ